MDFASIQLIEHVTSKFATSLYQKWTFYPGYHSMITDNRLNSDIRFCCSGFYCQHWYWTAQFHGSLPTVSSDLESTVTIKLLKIVLSPVHFSFPEEIPLNCPREHSQMVVSWVQPTISILTPPFLWTFRMVLYTTTWSSFICTGFVFILVYHQG